VTDLFVPYLTKMSFDTSNQGVCSVQGVVKLVSQTLASLELCTPLV